MSVDFDTFPVYDSLTKTGTNKLSDVWTTAFATFIQTLQSYLTQNGAFIPPVTTAQRDALQNVSNGQLIYNTSNKRLEVRQEGNWMPASVARLTATEITTLLTAPTDGEIIFNTTTSKLQGRESGAWVNLI